MAASALGMLPERTYNSIQIRRRAPEWRRARAIFIHIPKTAGVSLSHALYGRPLGHFAATEVRRVVPQDFEQLATFALIRDPIDRLQSAYAFATQGTTGEMAIRHPNRYQGSEFQSFETFVHTWLADKDVQSLDGVFRPQTLYVCEGGRVIVDDLLPLERLPRGLDRLEEAIGRPIVMPHRNASTVRVRIQPSTSAVRIIREKYAADFEMYYRAN